MAKESVTAKYGKQSGKNKCEYNVYGRAKESFGCKWCGIRIRNCSITANGFVPTHPFCSWTCGWRYGSAILRSKEGGHQ